MAFQDEVLTSDQAPASDQEHLHGRVWPFVIHADDILVVHGRIDDFLLGDHTLGGADAVAQIRGTLERQRFGGVLHLMPHIGKHTVGLAVQEGDHLVDNLAVVRVVDHPNAWGWAAFDVIVEACPRIIPSDDPIAENVRKEAIDSIERLSN